LPAFFLHSSKEEFEPRRHEGTKQEIAISWTVYGGGSNDRDTAVSPAGAAPPSVDFDAILTSLGATDQRLPPLMEMLLAPAPQSIPVVADASPYAPPAEEAAPGAEPPVAPVPNPALARLEEWLAAIERRRTTQSADRHANRPA